MITRRPVAPPAVRWIVGTLEDAGFDAWAVGGAVRDALLGLPSGDWDLATRATPTDVRRLFRRTVPIGVDHGTMGVLAGDGTLFEVTTFRRDVETDGRHAVVSFADTIEEDLSRRDFTINAVAWHPLRDELRDPFGGADDLERGVLRTVGVADQRFREDYLRILRALRFAGRFAFDVEPATWAAARDLVEPLRALSPERIREELVKVLGPDPRPRRALELYRESGAVDILYPELAHGWSDSIGPVEELPTGRPYLRLAALTKGRPADDIAAVLVRLRLSNAWTDEVARVAGAAPMPTPDAPDADARRWLGRHGPQRLTAAARLELAEAKARAAERPDREPLPEADPCAEVVAAWRRLREVRRAAPPLTVGDLEIDGRALIRLGLKPGPHFGTVLDACLEWVLDDPDRNEASALEARALEIAAAEGVDARG